MLILTMTLAVPAIAGTIDSPGVVAPPPPPGETNTPPANGIKTTVILTILNLIR
jgi:hypothetical protein